MAIMIKVEKRGSDFKTQLIKGIKIATKKLRLLLIVSILLNITLTYLYIK